MASIWDTLFPKQDYRTSAPSGGYADLYANGLLGNRTDTPASVEAMETGKDFIPVLSDVLAFGEAGHALSEGDRKTAAILAAGGLLSTIPGLGPTLARPVLAAGRKAADVASRIEVDPNAVGSLLGNVRMKPTGDAADKVTSFPVMQGRSKKGLDDFFNPDGLSWGTTSRETAEQFAGRNEVYWPNRTPPESSVEFSGDVYDLNFDLKNPMDVDISQTLWDRDRELALVSEAKSAGHDGLRISHPSGKVDYVAFDPSQVSRVAPPSPAELPEPRNEAEAMAKQVLEMRAAGDAGNVTEDMMALADDTYMYKNTPIDMSEASRLSRSEDFNPDYFHGSNADISGFDRSSRGTFLSSSPDLADSYVSRDGGQIYPVSVRGGSDFPIVEAGGSNFNRIPEAGLPEEFEYMKYDNNGRPFNTDFIVSQSSQEGSPGVLFSNIVDRGPNVKTYLGETSDEAKARAARASIPSDVTNVRYPHNIRSRFARFDPEFKHLKNLSAGVGAAPIGLLALREEQKRANEEQYKRGLLQ